MVAVIAGEGLGLFNNTLTQAGGASEFGQGKARISVNASTGNLVIQHQDEWLKANGIDSQLVRTYNSQGQLNNQAGFYYSFNQSLHSLTGEVNKAGSSIIRVHSDGHEALYHYDEQRKLYISSDGAGAHDSLQFDSSKQQWTWVEGSSQRQEHYNWQQGIGRLTAIADVLGRSSKIQYNEAGQVATIIDASGQTLRLAYDDSRLKSVTTIYDDPADDQGELTATRTRYQYDGLGRLIAVNVDLTPEDNDIADGNVYTTEYHYTGDSNRIALIKQSDQTQIAFAYDPVIEGGNTRYRISQVTMGEGADAQITRYVYDDEAKRTDIIKVVDQQTQSGQTTSLWLDEQGRINRQQMPANESSQRLQIDYLYDEADNLIAKSDSTGRQWTYRYDAMGNQIEAVDPLGQKTTRNYSATHQQLLSETQYLTEQQTITRYWLRDEYGRERFVLDSNGGVTETRYQIPQPAANQADKIIKLTYHNVAFDLTTFSQENPPTTEQLIAWLNKQEQLGQVSRQEQWLDFRGQISRTLNWEKLTGKTGLQNESPELSTAIIQQHIYDPWGRLIKTVDPRNEKLTEQYSYDGLGRLLSYTNKLGQTTQTEYLDAQATVVITSASGKQHFSLFNRLGQRISEWQQGTEDNSIHYGQQQFFYNKQGRLSATINQSGAIQHRLYSQRGQLAAEIDATGAVTRYFYNLAGQKIKTVHLAQRLTAEQLNQLVEKDQQGQITGTRTVAIDQLISEINEQDRIIHQVLDTNGQIRFSIDGAGLVIERRFDSLGREISQWRYTQALNIKTTPNLKRLEQWAQEHQANAQLVNYHWYNNAGHRLASLNAEGYLTEFFYNASGQRVGKTQYATRAVDLTAGNPLFQLDSIRPAQHANDQTTWLFYDSLGREIAQIDPEGYVTSWVYDEVGNKTQQTRYSGALTTETLARLAGWAKNSTKGLSGRFDSGEDQLIVMINNLADGNERITRYKYDAKNRLIAETNHQGFTTHYQYNVQGKLITTTKGLVVNEQGEVTDNSQTRITAKKYDSLGHLISETNALGGVTQHSYDRTGRRISTLDANGHRSWFYYNRKDQLTHTINALGEVTACQYNAFGEKVEQRIYANQLAPTQLPELNGGLVTQQFNQLIMALAAEEDVKSQYLYDKRGLLNTRIDGEGYRTESQYNLFGQLTQLAKAVKQNQAGNIETAQVSQFSYDKLGQQIAEHQLINGQWQDGEYRSAELLTHQQAYDAFGRVIGKISPLGHSQQFQYDRLGRQLLSIDPTGAESHTTYDTFGRVLSKTDSLGHTTTFTYVNQGQTLKVTTPEGLITETQLNRHGEKITVKAPDGSETHYQYNGAGQLIKTTDAEGHVSSQHYNQAGQKISTTSSIGLVTDLKYDPAGRLLTRIVDPKTTENPNGQQLTETFAYDSRGNRVRHTDAKGTVTVTEYDSNNQVVKTIIDPEGLELITEYQYDGLGNQVNIKQGDAKGWVRETQHQYDDQGRLIKIIIDPNGLKLTTRFTYNANNQLVAKTAANGGITRYWYDEAGRETIQVNPIGAVVTTEYDSNGQKISQRAYSQPLADTTDWSQSADNIKQLLTSSVEDRISYRRYDQDGRVVVEIEPGGKITQFAYNTAGEVNHTRVYQNNWPADKPVPATAELIQQLSVAIESDQQTITTETRAYYNAVGQVRFTIDGLGYITEYQYNNNGQKIATKQFKQNLAQLNTGSGSLSSEQVIQLTTEQFAEILENTDSKTIQQFTYDQLGRVQYTLDAAGFITEYHYDELGQEITQLRYQMTLSENNFAADNNELTTATVNQQLQANAALAQANYQVFDKAGRLRFLINDQGQVTERRYNAVGELIDTLRYKRSVQLASHSTGQPNVNKQPNLTVDKVQQLLNQAPTYLMGKTQLETINQPANQSYELINHVNVYDQQPVTNNASLSSMWLDKTREPTQPHKLAKTAIHTWSNLTEESAKLTIINKKLTQSPSVVNHLWRQNQPIRSSYRNKNGPHSQYVILVPGGKGYALNAGHVNYSDRTVNSVTVNLFDKDGHKVSSTSTPVGGQSGYNYTNDGDNYCNKYWITPKNWAGQANLISGDLPAGEYRAEVIVTDSIKARGYKCREPGDGDGRWSRVTNLNLVIGTILEPTIIKWPVSQEPEDTTAKFYYREKGFSGSFIEKVVTTDGDQLSVTLNKAVLGEIEYRVEYVNTAGEVVKQAEGIFLSEDNQTTETDTIFISGGEWAEPTTEGTALTDYLSALDGAEVKQINAKVFDANTGELVTEAVSHPGYIFQQQGIYQGTVNLAIGQPLADGQYTIELEILYKDTNRAPTTDKFYYEMGQQASQRQQLTWQPTNQALANAVSVEFNYRLAKSVEEDSETAWQTVTVNKEITTAANQLSVEIPTKQLALNSNYELAINYRDQQGRLIGTATGQWQAGANQDQLQLKEIYNQRVAMQQQGLAARGLLEADKLINALSVTAVITNSQGEVVNGSEPVKTEFINPATLQTPINLWLGETPLAGEYQIKLTYHYQDGTTTVDTKSLTLGNNTQQLPVTKIALPHQTSVEKVLWRELVIDNNQYAEAKSLWQPDIRQPDQLFDLVRTALYTWSDQIVEPVKLTLINKTLTQSPSVVNYLWRQNQSVKNIGSNSYRNPNTNLVLIPGHKGFALKPGYVSYNDRTISSITINLYDRNGIQISTTATPVGGEYTESWNQDGDIRKRRHWVTPHNWSGQANLIGGDLNPGKYQASVIVRDNTRVDGDGKWSRTTNLDLVIGTVLEPTIINWPTTQQPEDTTVKFYYKAKGATNDFIEKTVNKENDQFTVSLDQAVLGELAYKIEYINTAGEVVKSATGTVLSEDNKTANFSSEFISGQHRADNTVGTSIKNYPINLPDVEVQQINAKVYDVVTGNLVSEVNTHPTYIAEVLGQYQGEVNLSVGSPLADGRYRVKLQAEDRSGVVHSLEPFIYEIGQQDQSLQIITWPLADMPLPEGVTWQAQIKLADTNQGWTTVPVTQVGESWQLNIPSQQLKPGLHYQLQITQLQPLTASEETSQDNITRQANIRFIAANDQPLSLTFAPIEKVEPAWQTATVTGETNAQQLQFIDLATGDYQVKLTLKGIGEVNGELQVTDQGASLMLPELNAEANAQHSRQVRDSAGRVLYSIDAEGYVTEYQRNGLGQAIKTIQYATAIDFTAAELVNKPLTPQLIKQQLAAQSVSDHALDNMTAVNYDLAGNKQLTQVKATGEADQYWQETYQNNAFGERTNVTDANGDRQYFAYDQAGRVVRELKAIDKTNGQLTAYEYDSQGHKTAVTEYLGPVSLANGAGQPIDANAEARVTHYRYDANSQLIAQLGPDFDNDPAVKIRYEYDSSGNRIAQVEFAGAETRRTEWQYNTLNQKISETRGVGTAVETTTRYQYDSLGNLTATIDPRGIELTETNSNWAKAERMRLGYGDKLAAQLTEQEITTLLGQYTKTAQWDSTGNQVRQIDAAGNTIRSQYDAAGNLIKAIDGRGFIRHFYYDNNNRLMLEIDSEGYATETRYNANNKVTAQIRYQASLKDQRFDEFSDPQQLIQQLQAKGIHHQTLYRYDNLDRLITKGDGQFEERYQYDGVGNRIAVTDKNGHTTRYEFNAVGQQTKMITPEVRVVNAKGEVINQQLVTEYHFDGFGRKVRQVEAANTDQVRTTEYVYDAHDRVLEEIQQARWVGGELSGAEEKPVIKRRYDSAGQLLSETDGAGNTTYHYYDALGREVATVSPLMVLTKYVYDSAGNKIAQRVYDQPLTEQVTVDVKPQAAADATYRETHFRFNGLNQQVATLSQQALFFKEGATLPGQQMTKQLYDANGNLVKAIDGNGNTQYRFYDGRNLPVISVDATGYVVKSRYDSAGNIIEQTQYAELLPTTFFSKEISEYTTVAELTAQLKPSAQDRITQYRYDALNRKVEERVLNVAYGQVNDQGQFNQGKATAVTRYEYDGLGHVTAIYKGGESSQDGENTTGEVLPGGETSLLQYDALGRQTLVRQATYLNEKGQSVAPTETQYYDGLGNVAIKVKEAADGKALDYHLSDQDQVERFEYDAAGLLRRTSNPTHAEVRYDYNLAGQIITKHELRTQFEDGVTPIATYYEYDQLGREIAKQDAVGDRYETVYNSHGEIIEKRVNGKQHQFYQYDQLGRLTLTNEGNGTPRFFGYDQNGNVTLEVAAANENLTIDSLQDLFNQQKPIQELADLSVTVNRYDARNQLTAVIKPEISTEHFAEELGENTEIIPGKPFQRGGAFIEGGEQFNISFTLHARGRRSNWPQVHYNLYPVNFSWQGLDGYQGNLKVDWQSGFKSGHGGSKTFSANNGMGAIQLAGGGVSRRASATSIFNDGLTYKLKVSRQNDASDWSTLLDTRGRYQWEGVAPSPGGGGTDVQVKSHQLPRRLVLTDQPRDASRVRLYYRPATGVDYGSQEYQEENYNPALYTHYIDGALAKRTGSNSRWVLDLSHAPGMEKGRDYEYYYEVLDSKGRLANRGEGQIDYNGTDNTTVSHHHTGRPKVVHKTLGYILSNTSQLTQHAVHKKQRFNAFGEIAATTDGRGNTTHFEYSSLGKLTLKQDPEVSATHSNGFIEKLNPQTQFHYDLLGRQVGTTDANGHTNTQRWVADKVLGEYHADGGQKTYQYDGFGNKLAETNEIGQTTRYQYDKSGNLIKLDRVGDNDERYEYDETGQRIARFINRFNEHGEMLKETYQYDGVGRVIQHVSFGGKATRYNYHFQGNIGSAVYNPVEDQYTTDDTQAVGGWVKITTNPDGKTLIDHHDLFGRIRYHQDMGGRKTWYDYNQAGWLINQRGDTVIGNDKKFDQEIHYSYYKDGYIKAIADHGIGSLAEFKYDENGNLIFEGYRIQNPYNGYAEEYTQRSRVSYDALNRISRIIDDKYDVRYEYDSVGNRRRVFSRYLQVNGHLDSQDFWYDYDSMNRFVITQGQLNGNRAKTKEATSSQVVRGTTGYDITYNSIGQRISATKGKVKETYTYGSDGFLEQTFINLDINQTQGIGQLRAKRVNDAIGNTLEYVEYSASGAVTRHLVNQYNSDNQKTQQTKKHDDNKYTQYFYDDAGNMSYSQDYGDSTNIKTTYAYEYWDNYKRKEIKVKATTDQKLAYKWQPGFSQFEYDVNGHTVRALDDYNARHFDYIANHKGQILRRIEKGEGYVKTHQFYFINGVGIGDVGDDGPSYTDYATQLAVNQGQQRVPDRITPVYSADFDANYIPISENYPAQTPGSYTIQKGDTLQSIALALWGDSSLWFLLADANGLDPTESLKAGMVLTVPNKVTNIHNNSNTFRPYDPGIALGDVGPTLPDAPPPPGVNGGCGAAGFIIMIVVVAVAIWTGGAALSLVNNPGFWAYVGAGAAGAAAGNAAGQLAGMALGVQDSFSFSQVAKAGLQGAVSAGITQGLSAGIDGLAAGESLGSISWIKSAAASVSSTFKQYQGLQQAVGSVLNQAVGKAVGWQDKINWQGVAASGVAGAVKNHFDINPSQENPGSPDHINAVLIDQGVAAVVYGKDFNWQNAAANVIGTGIGVGIAQQYSIGREPTRQGRLEIEVTDQDVEDVIANIGKPSAEKSLQAGLALALNKGVYSDGIKVAGANTLSFEQIQAAAAKDDRIQLVNGEWMLVNDEYTPFIDPTLEELQSRYLAYRNSQFSQSSKNAEPFRKGAFRAIDEAVSPWTDVFKTLFFNPQLAFETVINTPYWLASQAYGAWQGTASRLQLYVDTNGDALKDDYLTGMNYLSGLSEGAYVGAITGDGYQFTSNALELGGILGLGYSGRALTTTRVLPDNRYAGEFSNLDFINSSVESTFGFRFQTPYEFQAGTFNMGFDPTKFRSPFTSSIDVNDYLDVQDSIGALEHLELDIPTPIGLAPAAYIAPIEVRSLNELLPNGRIPTVRQGFNEWFDGLSVEELRLITSDTKRYDDVADRIRNGGSKHEWLMVREMEKVKSWGVPMDEVHRFTTNTLDLKWKHPLTGAPGAHTVIVNGRKQSGPGSKAFHIQLQKLIQQSETLDDYNKGVTQLRDLWSIDPMLLPSLPKAKR
ncbi:LysM peptidoglycan-binding domain-containing protein [Spartinivicinus ruber]|uniref:LysM peptidoglycan-binding domain-containing protein n=1 Tax=Spartinivicinus ruber TaxID=2683272 RepID=UPI0013D3F6FB|nr:LysM peptidoglycan-binding domain-containing protein [Spartinivicinus ruber]